MDGVQLTSDLQELVNQGVISREDARSMMGSGKPAATDTNKMKKSKQKTTMSLDDKINMMLINTNADGIEQSSTSASTSAPDGGSDLPVELSQNVAKPKVKAKKAPITVISNQKSEKAQSSLQRKNAKGLKLA